MRADDDIFDPDDAVALTQFVRRYSPVIESALREATLLRALDLLPADDRALLHLYYYENLSLSDISFIMSAGRRTLASRL